VKNSKKLQDEWQMQQSLLRIEMRINFKWGETDRVKIKKYYSVKEEKNIPSRII
jgi:hypothetical protein